MRTPKFFCENCRREVAARDRVCPGCGRFFSDVRCPRCGFTGGAGQFYGGCPRCGYLSSPAPSRRKERSVRIPVSRSPEREWPGTKKMQLWFFLFVVIGLALILSIILSIYIDRGRGF